MKTLTSILVGIIASSQLVHAQRLVIKGSDTLGAKLVPQLAEAYKASHPNVSFQIAAEGSSTGIAALTDNTCNIAMSSRRAKPTEVSAASAKGINMKPTVVAYDGLAVVVNDKNPIKSLTKKQVEQIFTGDVTDWSALGGSPGKISVYTRNTSSGTYSDWKELAMKKRDYAGSSQKMAGNEQIAAEVGKNASGIGYVGMAYDKAPNVKVVSIDGKLPSVATVHDKSYPYARPTFYYTNGEPTGLAGDFVKFTIGSEGQKIVSQVGFVPIP